MLPHLPSDIQSRHTPPASSRPRRAAAIGFTLLELLVVLAIIATLLTVAAPRYMQSVERAREVALRQTLATVRDALDRYHGDTGNYPAGLEKLVARQYLRSLPVDPVTDSNATWVLLPEPNARDTRLVYDVKKRSARSRARWKTQEHMPDWRDIVKMRAS